MTAGTNAFIRPCFAVDVCERGVTLNPGAPMIHRKHHLCGASNLLEVALSVAHFAVGTEVAAVRIAVTFEATMTTHRKCQIELSNGELLPIRDAQRQTLRTLRLMAQETCRFLMRARLCELGHAVVVKLWCAFLGTVALGAVLAKFTAMLVVFRVTIEAAVLIHLVLVLAVTCLASDGLVFAFKLEDRVVKTFC